MGRSAIARWPGREQLGGRPRTGLTVL